MALEWLGLGEMAKSFLQHGIQLFLGVQDELEKINSFQEDIRDLIATAERSPVMDSKLKKLLEKLKDAAHDAEDFLEVQEIKARSLLMSPKLKQLLKMLKDASYDAEEDSEDQRRDEEAQYMNMSPHQDSIPNKVRKVVSSIINRAVIAMEVKELSERLEAMIAESHEFKLSEKVISWDIKVKKERDTYSLPEQSQVLGRQREKKEIVNWLLSTNQEGDWVTDEYVPVISIVGMGGIGKTTLAKLVFNQERVQNHFELKMWVFVSAGDFDVLGLGEKIIQCAKGGNPSLSCLQQLHSSIQKALWGKRFLLVLDDVWNEEPKMWHILREVLRCGKKGSRIIVTKRSRNVASIMSEREPLILQGLSEDDCRSLFSRLVFGNRREEEAHPNLVRIGREMVKKCRENPLAVTTLGGLLCCERGESEREFVRDSETWNLDGENEYGILPALRLSYNHLKPHLKQCFAFCAVFPKGYKIEKELLIKLWMANGFIPPKRGMELEDIGNEIFDELVMRSFFQIVSAENACTTFMVEDLMLDLARSVMENECCASQYGKSIVIPQKVRHVFAIPTQNLVSSIPENQRLRTYIMFEVAEVFHCDIRQFRFLRALDLRRQEEGAEKLLLSIGNLQHLRYLNLSYSKIKELPESLSSLYYLQALILRYCKNLRVLPKKIGKLTNLRCLDIIGCYRLTHMPAKMWKLSCLRELTRFIVGKTNEVASSSIEEGKTNEVVLCSIEEGKTNEVAHSIGENLLKILDLRTEDRRTDKIACSGIGELQSLKLRGHLSIECLENITDVIDVQRANLSSKQNLTSLDLLWMHDCTHFQNLGVDDEGGETEKLEKQVLEVLRPHQTLQKLNISGYLGIDFPSWITDTTFTKLVNIVLYKCWRCKHLPPLGQLPLLKVLEICLLKNVEAIGDEFYGNDVSGGFPSLETLRISKLGKLTTWSGWKGQRLFPELINFRIYECPMLTTITFLTDFKDLNTVSSLSSVEEPLCQGLMESFKDPVSFNIIDCTKPNDTSFTKLVNIVLYECWGCKHLPALGQLPSLKVLEICFLKNVESIGDEFYGNDVSGGFPSLEMLRISKLGKLKTWSGSGWKGQRLFPKLINFGIHECPMLTTVTFLPDFKDLNTGPSLSSVEEPLCQGFKESFKNLVTLNIIDCTQLESFPMRLYNLTSLESLHLFRCNILSFLDGDEMRCLTSLRHLAIGSCDKLISSLVELQYLTSLGRLRISDSTEFAHVANELSFLTNLQILELFECHGLRSLPKGIEKLTSLQYLSIYNCPEMDSLPGELRCLTALKRLRIEDCPALKIRCEKNTGKDWHKIKHIPDIDISELVLKKERLVVDQGIEAEKRGDKGDGTSCEEIQAASASTSYCNLL